MVFVPPNWLEGGVLYASYMLIPLIIAAIIRYYTWTTDKHNKLGWALTILFIFIGVVGSQVIWFETMEVPSVDEKVVTVENWQPVFGKYWGEIGGADDLMMQTTDGELFFNKEKMLFNKFETRDVFNALKPNGTYKIKYYGWRNGFNDGAPNILSVEKVVNESNAKQNHDITNYMNKRSIMYEGSDLLN